MNFRNFLGSCLLLLPYLWLTTANANNSTIQILPPLNWHQITTEQYINNLVQCEAKIQEFKWSQNKWPENNPKPKPSFNEHVDYFKIEQQVKDILKKQNALETHFNTSISTNMLQQDLYRMAKNTRDTKKLTALYSLLGNDPQTIGECISRPNLINKMFLSQFNWDFDIHQTTRTLAENELFQFQNNALDLLKTAKPVTLTFGRDDEFESNNNQIKKLKSAHYEQLLKRAKVKEITETAHAFVYSEIIEATNTQFTIKRLNWPKINAQQWLDNQPLRFPKTTIDSTDLYLPKINKHVQKSLKVDQFGDTWEKQTFAGRFGHTALWTGNEMIIWGGFALTDNSLERTNTGARYNPVTDTWTAMSQPINARVNHSAVWTGTEMLIWGGNSDTETFNTGVKYNPISDNWTTFTSPSAPSARDDHTAVWTGDRMIVWGGVASVGGATNSGGIYDPVANTWSEMSTSSAPQARSFHTAVWADNQMIVWGGLFVSDQLNTGGSYDPNTDTWTNLNTPPAFPGRTEHSAVWTGNEMIVWGGLDQNLAYLGDGAKYDPNTTTWTALSNTGSPTARSSHSAVWDGSQMIVFGGRSSGLTIYNDTIKYDPNTDSWAAITTPAALEPRYIHTAVFTGTEMIIWGGVNSLNFPTIGGKYNPQTDNWRSMSSISPSGRNDHTAIWTGNEMIVWGGNDDTEKLNTGGKYDPITDNWTQTSRFNSPQSRDGHTAIWSGTEMIVWGGSGDDFLELLNSGGRYDPINDSWITMSTSNAPTGRSGHSAVITGNRMIIWGGFTPNYTNTGASYNTITDNWQATSTTDAPVARGFHTGVWTDDGMIIWGGRDTNNYYDSGALFDPINNAWTSITNTNAPDGRINHTAVWTGSDMIIWGGTDNTVHFQTGGKYNPTTDTWNATATLSAPSARDEHTAIWNGRQMIIWGGEDDSEMFNTGGRYSPNADQWLSTSTDNAPSPRSRHTSVWTDSEMLVWGGDLDNTLGSYYPFNTYTIGGTLNGLEGDQITLQNNSNETLVLTENGIFDFTESLIQGSDYDVTITALPTNPEQECSISNASGMNITQDVIDILVTCEPSDVIFKNSFEEQ